SVPINLGSLSVDMMAVSGHKALMGPQGVGALYIRNGVSPTPLKHGGTGSASSDEVQPEIMPDKYESGTPNTPGIAGLSAALDFLASETVDKIRRSICEAGTVIYERLRSIDKIFLHSPDNMEHNVGIFSFIIKEHDPAQTARELEESYGVMTRVGLHCAPSAHKVLGTFPQGTIRASIGYFTTIEEIKYFLNALEEVSHAR
ncbi:MAG: aminotransferase class V-fold PLP-dependent enzyme, partial [Thermoplasmata archaeon]|nr:aminotransferase class V-fold PLP-dependent enzyme [Thermoplasmata archaeon]